MQMFSIGLRIFKSFDQFPKRFKSHYAVLGVTQTAHLEEIKAAFRKKAKIIHPDAAAPHGTVSSSSTTTEDRKDWVQLLTAYQILSDARSRHLYDLSRSSSSSSFLRQAAASGVKNGVHEDVEIDLNWNLGRAWTTNRSKNREEQDNNQDSGGDGNNKNKNYNSSTVLDQLRNNLESDWHAAIRHAYLGPRLDDLQHGQLPDCFEADERATNNTNEILQLVSGRQQLGSVRLRTANLLTESERKAWLGQGQCMHANVRKDPALIAAFEVAELPPHSSSAAAAENIAESGGASDAFAASYSLSQSSSTIGTKTQDKINTDTNEPSTTETSVHADPKISSSTFPRRRQPQILDLYLDDEIVATAVSRPAVAANSDTTFAKSPKKEENEAEAEGENGDDEALQGVLTTYFYRGDTLVAQLIEEEPSLATTRRCSASKLLDPSGQHVFSIIRNITPLVRHITFASEHTTAAGMSFGKEERTKMNTIKPNLIKKKTIVARAQRAWLPPSSLWLFKPRSYDHDIGGWVISWAGESQRDHPAWLDPSVLTLVAALDTLDYEKAKQQPYGLFQRLKSVGSSGGSDVLGSNSGGGRKVLLNWVRDMLRFHQGSK